MKKSADEMSHAAAELSRDIPVLSHPVEWWAALEERVIKLACGAIARAERLGGSSAYLTAPWLDIYYRKRESN